MVIQQLSYQNLETQDSRTGVLYPGIWHPSTDLDKNPEKMIDQRRNIPTSRQNRCRRLGKILLKETRGTV